MSEPAAELVAVVSRSSVAALLVRIPSVVILAASRSAGELAGMESAELVGQHLEELTADDPPGALELLRNGRLTGYETERAFKTKDGSVRRLKVWVRVLKQVPPIEFAVGVLWPIGAQLTEQLPSPGPDEPQAVFGTISPELLIERISEDVSVFGLDAGELVGAPILRLVTKDSAADTLVALAEAATRAAGVCLVVLLEGSSGTVSAQLLIRRLLPSMSFAFSLVVPGEDDGGGPLGAEEALRVLGRGLQALDTGRVAEALDRAPHAGAERLSSRELEIVARLVSGDRVPAIAQALFLSQTTIRNHLSSAYRKLRVASQQELIDLFRERLSG